MHDDRPGPYQPGHKNYLDANAPPAPASASLPRWLVWAIRLILIGAMLVTALFLLLEEGRDYRARMVLAGLGVAVFTALSLMTRDLNRPAGRLETVMASCWLWFRRIVSATVGGLVLVAAIWGTLSGADWRMLGGLYFLALFILYVGWFGQGNSRAHFNDDVALHRQNRRRYRWWS